MQPSGRIRPIILISVLAIGVTLTLPYLALGAGHATGRSGGFRAARTHRQRAFSHPFQRFGFVGVDEPSDQEVIIQQFQPPPVSEPTEPAKKGVYVQPRWVDGGYGVEVLQPGYWADPEKAPGH
jgi:hypothetical protein